MSISRTTITQLLRQWRDGDERALNELLTVIYAELHRLARGYMRRERHGHTLQTTALINEAYLRLARQRRIDWRSRAQFFGIAAQFMRRILVDHARAHHYAKRGGPGLVVVPIDEADPVRARQGAGPARARCRAEAAGRARPAQSAGGGAAILRRPHG